MHIRFCETPLRSLKILIFDITDSKIQEFVTRSDLNGLLSLILYDVEGPLSWSDKRCRKLPRPLRSKSG